MLLPLFGIIFSFVIFSYYFTKWKTIKLENRPPGPFPLPIIGHLHLLIWKKLTSSDKPYRTLTKIFNDKYGPIASLQLGQVYGVVTDDFDTIKEIIHSDAWLGRHFDALYQHRSWSKPYGILFSSGDEWKEMRRFTLRTLRDFGFGRHTSMDDAMTEELTDLIGGLNERLHKGQTVVPMQQFFSISVLNIIWRMITGTRFTHDDTKLKRLLKLSSEINQTQAVGENLANFFPILAGYYAKGLHTELQQYIRDLLEETRARQDYKDDQKDFVEVFLKEIDNHQGQSPNYYTDEQFIIVVMDLFMAGGDSTASTLEYAIMHMILNPDIQEKIQCEIDSVIGSSRPPVAADRQNMPITEAALLEVHRMTSILPLDGKASVEDTTIRGYNIKKGTPVVLNFHSVHYSKKIWKNPDEFDPTRFLDSDNNIINAHKIIPFGGGKRICLGETLAKLGSFSYFVGLLQKFKFTKVAGEPDPSIDPIVGFSLRPKAYSVQVSHR